MTVTYSQAEQLERIRKSPFLRLAFEIDIMSGISNLRAANEIPEGAVFMNGLGQPYEIGGGWRDYADTLRQAAQFHKEFASRSPLPNELDTTPEAGLAKIRQWCVESASTAKQLESLSDALQQVLDALEGKILMAKEIVAIVDPYISEDAIRQRIRKIRKTGRKIYHLPGVGYYRPDAPPLSVRN